MVGGGLLTGLALFTAGPPSVRHINNLGHTIGLSANSFITHDPIMSIGQGAQLTPHELVNRQSNEAMKYARLAGSTAGLVQGLHAARKT